MLHHTDAFPSHLQRVALLLIDVSLQLKYNWQQVNYYQQSIMCLKLHFYSSQHLRWRVSHYPITLMFLTPPNYLKLSHLNWLLYYHHKYGCQMNSILFAQLGTNLRHGLLMYSYLPSHHSYHYPASRCLH